MGQKRVTVIDDIVHAAGVSKSTVSLVPQGSSTPREETRARVQDAIRRLGYVYNRREAANLRQPRSKIARHNRPRSDQQLLRRTRRGHGS